MMLATVFVAQASFTLVVPFGMRALTGLLSGFLPAATSLVATNTPEDKMGYALGLFQAVNAAGTISGPLVGAVMVGIVGMGDVHGQAQQPGGERREQWLSALAGSRLP